VPRRRAIPVALGVACYALALLQRPGTVYADTKVDLLVDPLGFLGEVTGAWTEQIGLGHVFGGQYGGYLFPMGPWFWLFERVGAPDWVAQRLWLATILFAAGAGPGVLFAAASPVSSGDACSRQAPSRKTAASAVTRAMRMWSPYFGSGFCQLSSIIRMIPEKSFEPPPRSTNRW